MSKTVKIDSQAVVNDIGRSGFVCHREGMACFDNLRRIAADLRRRVEGVPPPPDPPKNLTINEASQRPK